MSLILVAGAPPDTWQFQLGDIYFNTNDEPDDDGLIWTMPEPDGWRSPAVRLNAVDIPFADGQDIGDVFFQARTIHATGAVQCVTARGDEGAAALERGMSRLLRATRLLREDGQFIGRDSTGVWYANCRRGDRTAFPTRYGPEAASFDFVLVAGDPYKYALLPTGIPVPNATPNVGGVASPWHPPIISTTFPQAAVGTPTSSNHGDLDAPFHVDFVGNLVNPRLYDRVNGYRIGLKADIPGDRTVRVDGPNQTVFSDSTPVYEWLDTTFSTPLDQLVVPAEGSCVWTLIAQGNGHALVTHRDCKE